MRSALPIFIVLTVALAPVCGCTCSEAVRTGAADDAGEPESEAVAERAPVRAERVVLIVVDSLRPDEVSDAEETPAFARLASEGTAMRAVSGASECLASVGTILTSLDPDRHGAGGEGVRALPQAVWTLPEVLRCEGIATASFLANGFLSDRFGITQGFDHHVNHLHERRRSTADAVLGDALEWITAHREERFFVYAHLIDPHLPYDPPAPFAPPDEPAMPRPRDTGELLWQGEVRELRHGRSRVRPLREDEARWFRALRRGEVRFLDAQLGVFLSALDELGLGGSTLVVVTSDHGERLGEEGSFGHAREGAELLSVPLFFRGPMRPAPSDEVVHHRDLAPTALEAMGFEVSPRFEGRSVGPRRLRAPEGPRIDYEPVQVQLDRERCEYLNSLVCPLGLDCDQYPSAAELAEISRAIPNVPCAEPSR